MEFKASKIKLFFEELDKDGNKKFSVRCDLIRKLGIF